MTRIQEERNSSVARMVEWINLTTTSSALLFPPLSKFKAEGEEESDQLRLGHMTSPWLYGAIESKAPLLQILGRREIPEITLPTQYTHQW